MGSKSRRPPKSAYQKQLERMTAQQRVLFKKNYLPIRQAFRERQQLLASDDFTSSLRGTASADEARDLGNLQGGGVLSRTARGLQEIEEASSNSQRLSGTDSVTGGLTRKIEAELANISQGKQQFAQSSAFSSQLAGADLAHREKAQQIRQNFYSQLGASAGSAYANYSARQPTPNVPSYDPGPASSGVNLEGYGDGLARNPYRRR